MSLSFETPITIVGQGLAGSLLAWTLLQQGKDVHIFAGDKPSASRVAAGMINPVTGQRFVLAEHTPDMLKFAKLFYRDIEQKLNASFFHEKPMFRLFNSQKERKNCEKRLENNTYTDFLNKKPMPSCLNHEHGGIVQQQTAWLDTNTLLDTLHTYFEQHACITHQNFSGCTTNQHIIYCEGYHMMSNPLFSWLPLQPAHGEIITCTSDKALPNYIINQSKWLLPTSEYQCRIGATYESNINTPTLQESSRQQLLAFVKAIFTEQHNIEVIKQQAGIRPTTRDKQPFIGTHPNHKNIHIFNGFGSRGSLMIPWYAHQLLRNNLPQEANIKRYQHPVA